VGCCICYSEEGPGRASSEQQFNAFLACDARTGAPEASLEHAVRTEAHLDGHVSINNFRILLITVFLVTYVCLFVESFVTTGITIFTLYCEQTGMGSSSEIMSFIFDHICQNPDRRERREP